MQICELFIRYSPEVNSCKKNQIPYIIEHTQPKQFVHDLSFFCYKNSNVNILRTKTKKDGFCPFVHRLFSLSLSVVIYSDAEANIPYFLFIFHCNIDHFMNSFHSHVSNYIHAIVRFLDNVHLCGFWTSKIAFFLYIMLSPMNNQNQNMQQTQQNHRCAKTES